MQPDTLTPAQARQQLDTAQREADEARGLVEDLRERVRNGDDVTAEQLGSQQQLAELAQLRVTAAERKLKAALAADVDARAHATADRIRDLVADDSTEPILDAVLAVTGAVRALLRVTGERHAAIRQVAVEGVAVNEELGRNPDEPWPSRAYDFMAQTTPELSVTAVGQGAARAIPAGRVLGVVLRAVLEDGTVRRQTTEMIGLSAEGLARHTAAVPGLAEALAAREDTEG